MNKKIVKNTFMLYVMNIAKLILPLITLPYLTRVLSVEGYAVVSYVKATMQYMQLIVDFGFLLSGTRDIVKAKSDKNGLGIVTGDILLARIILSVGAFVILLIATFSIEMLRNNILFTLLSFVPIFLTCFLFDYLFRGIEKMEIITIRFVVMKGIAAVLTFILVKQDADILFIPILDIIGSLVAIILVLIEIKKLEIHIKISKFKNVFNKIKDSAVYFISNIATTAFMALNTLLIGIFMSERDVAFWALCLQLVTAVQALYTPLTDGIYPHMVENRDFNVIKKSLKLYLPIVISGCILTFFVADYVVLIVGGDKYIDAAPILQFMIPVMFFSFLAMIFGWPSLGAIGKQKEVTVSTVITAIIQILGLFILIISNNFTLINIAVLRGITECILFAIRFRYLMKYKNDFV